MALFKILRAGCPLASRTLQNGKEELVTKSRQLSSLSRKLSRRHRHAPSPTPQAATRFCQTVSHQELSLPLLLENRDLDKLMDMYDTFLLDCDGVLWPHDHCASWDNIGHSINRLRAHGKRIIFVTNNSMHTRHFYLDKFRKACGFEADMDDVFTVSYAAAVYLKSIAQVRGKVFALGSKGMMDELDSVGLDSFGYGLDQDPISDQWDDLLSQRLDPDVEAVLIGFDIHIGYNKIYKAASYLSQDSCHYVSTNDVETRVPIGPERVLPLSGALMEAINAASQRKPVVVGKPHAHLLACVLSTHPGVDLQRTVMVGDSLHTDINFAASAGIDSILVLTGSTSPRDLQTHCLSAGGDQATPTYVLPSFGRFGERL